VVATPIGNLGDVSARALEVLRAVTLIAAEDTRITRRLLARYEITTRQVSYHARNAAAREPDLLAHLRGGLDLAVVTDAGTPLVSDPGHELLRECLREELPVEVLPGASAAVTALVASGLPGARWCFAGFLPRKRGELRELFTAADETLVAYESPRRLSGTLAVLAELDPQRPAAVCRELTKLHEEVARGSAAELAEHFGTSEVRGEVTLVVGAAGAAAERPREEALAALRELVAAGARPRAAAAAVAKLTGLGANELYRGLTGPAE
jgi:16S rRNA (cytidine1402-2'-O)-methyltransferase